MNLEQIKELKVENFIHYSEAELRACQEIMRELAALDTEFNTSQDISDLEFYVGLQKKMNGFLLSFSTHYSKLKSKKDILERKRKEWKSKIITYISKDSLIPDEDGNVNKISINQAEKLVDGDERYIYICTDILDKLMSYINTVDTKFWHHTETLKMIHQSVGIARGEKNNTETT